MTSSYVNFEMMNMLPTSEIDGSADFLFQMQLDQ